MPRSVVDAPGRRRNVLIWSRGAFAAALVLGVCAMVATDYWQDRNVEARARHDLQQWARVMAFNAQKTRAAGVMLALGRVSPEIRRFAVQGAPAFSSGGQVYLDAQRRAFGFSSLAVLDRRGVTVAYAGQPGRERSELGKVRAGRPYFGAALRGQPYAYVGFGHSTARRGVYLAAPVMAPASASVAGVVVAKIGFEGVDALLARETAPLMVVSPEGVVFASNVPEWLYHLVPGHDPREAMRSTRTDGIFASRAPPVLPFDPDGTIEDGFRQGKLISVALPWDDSSDGWRLATLVDLHAPLRRAASALAGAGVFLAVLLFGAWLRAQYLLRGYARQLEGKNAELAILTHTDALTGVGNRRLFDRALREEWSRSRRAEQVLVLIMIDVDFFKKYNDHYGHQAGDDCLRAVAGALRAWARRPSDRFCRYGGEEFALILSERDPAAGLRMAESMRSAIEALDIPHSGSPYGRVTVSVGLAILPGASPAGPGALLRAADKALYRAKAQGRNGVADAGDIAFL